MLLKRDGKNVRLQKTNRAGGINLSEICLDYTQRVKNNKEEEHE